MTCNRPTLYSITQFETITDSFNVLFTDIKKPALTGRDMSFTGDRERG